MKRVLLVGCGSEIGANLLLVNNPDIDGFVIDAVITKPTRDPLHTSIDSIYVRLLIAAPHMVDQISIKSDRELIVCGREITFHWVDIEKDEIPNDVGFSDYCILATSKQHLASSRVLEKLGSVSRYVFGVAENIRLPALYPSFVDALHMDLHTTCSTQSELTGKYYALGSCQSNGWLAAFRTVVDCILSKTDGGVSDLLAYELDIVHPDTPTGNLGTRSMNPRHQDPRDNLRPSESQVTSTMKRLYNDKVGINTVSLRVLTQPPGYQICRFYFKNCSSFDVNTIREKISLYSKISDKIESINKPLGSLAVKYKTASSVILNTAAHLKWTPSLFGSHSREPISELIIQQYVNNTFGYCQSLLRLLRYVSDNKRVMVFNAIDGE